MHANRTRIEIFANVLTVAQDVVLKTHIMYKANLSHKQLEKYLSHLLLNGLIEQIYNTSDRGNRFRITQKGAQFLEDYSRLSSYLGAEVLS